MIVVWFEKLEQALAAKGIFADDLKEATNSLSKMKSKKEKIKDEKKSLELCVQELLNKVNIFNKIIDEQLVGVQTPPSTPQGD
ncbi:hypothetical protein GYH30_034852 [Glycine max]|nr:hypothetical protein GYH30_034852 [Glycine max]